jgi:hypothetical protein
MDHWKKSGKKVKKFLQSNKNESATYQNLWYTWKEVLRRKF